MRKIGAILLMLLVCTVYILSIKQKDEATSKETPIVEQAISLEQKFEELKKILKSDYPGTPKEIIELYNEAITYQYSEEMTQDYVEDTITVMRMIYSQELIALNHYEGQVERLREEVLLNEQNKLYITKSSIESIEFTEENIAIVNVAYDTTLKTIHRTYYMVRENNHWKIHSWNDLVY